PVQSLLQVEDNNQELLPIPRRPFVCPICLDTIEEETSVSWCRHAFCFSCILEWCRIRSICPVCQDAGYEW
uniref:RING-type domain-containing protein n=1 Tax=Geospiza parvula TaxID=87175 RepID=A0A8U8B4M0_GEOPR